ncbi:DNA/RNA helicase domain-containing protein [Oceanobacillus sp. FSL H7-0719]|uniref:DNA/RNA helicase domain-containing protein n=1 Tax=Oceanobacillus sp. FSL H7-0719 TaxID=2954507 RepID=UPI00324AFE03
MIIYQSTAAEFIHDTINEVLVDNLYNAYQEKIGRTSKSEIRSWENSLTKMSNVLYDPQIPGDISVAIEFNIPNTSKRVDFIIAGNDGDNENVMIVELKQWEFADKVEGKEAIVETALGRGIRETVHPSYQAYTYASLITDFNESVRTNNINLIPCAYLHNYFIQDEDPLMDPLYGYYIEKAPVFRKGEINKLRNFVKKYIKYKDKTNAIVQIDQGKIHPSKSLQDALKGMIEGNQEFHMIDEQKVFFEEALYLFNKSMKDNKKRTMIVEGGPGTGKSVLAINMLVEIINRDRLAMYITKNAAPREVYAAKLQGTMKKTHINNLFKGSGSFTQAEENEFDVLIVDEAHRLNRKSGMFQNLGENQTKEIIHGSLFSIFFIDENQKVTFSDAGSIDEIEKYANDLGSEIIKRELVSQFRCDGSDGYIAWLDDVLEIRETANKNFIGMDYDFKVVDNPHELLSLIQKKNKIANKSRMMAGYCWEWPKKERRNVKHHDIMIGDFGMSWNLNTTWAIDNSSVEEAGCIHTAQGLEFDYIGVIIGDDMRYENGSITTDFTKRAKTDQSLKGIKKFAKENPEQANRIADKIIKNTYRTLMTRGQKGCYVYCTDKPLAEYLKSRIAYVEKAMDDIQMVAENPTPYVLDDE